MILDKKGKLFGKVSIIDLFVLLVLVIGVIGVFSTKSMLDQEKVLSQSGNMFIQSSREADKLEIAFEVKEVRGFTRDAIIVGDDVFVASNDRFLGVVSRVESVPSKRTVVTTLGKVYTAEVPERYDVTIYVETSGKKKDEGYFTDSNIKLIIGGEMEVKTSTVQTTPRVKTITVHENEQ